MTDDDDASGDTPGHEGTQPGVDGLGRRILLVVGAGTVLLGGFLGLFIGASGAEQVSEITVLGVLTVPMTPWAMAGYGIVVVTLVIIGLYGLISVAARFDSNAR